MCLVLYANHMKSEQANFLLFLKACHSSNAFFIVGRFLCLLPKVGKELDDEWLFQYSIPLLVT